MGDLEPMTQTMTHIGVLSPYHLIVIPEEDESCFGDQAWAMGPWDG